MDAHDTRARLIRLQTERFHALELGIENPSEYLTRLEEAIEDVRVEYYDLACARSPRYAATSPAPRTADVPRTFGQGGERGTSSVGPAASCRGPARR